MVLAWDLNLALEMGQNLESAWEIRLQKELVEWMEDSLALEKEAV